MSISSFLHNGKRQARGGALVEYILALSLFTLAVFAGSALLAQESDEAFKNVTARVGGGTIGTSTTSGVSGGSSGNRNPN